MPPSLPPAVADLAGRGPAWASWVDRLPRLVDDVLDAWELTRDGEATSGRSALVVPARDRSGTPAVLKVAGPRTVDGGAGDDHEALALQRIGGAGAVRLLRADPARGLLLLERLHARDLGELWDVEACEIVGGLYRRLHVPAPPQLRALPSYVERRADRLAALPRSAPVPHRLVEQAVALGRDLAADPASTGTLVHGDLHFAHVLAGDREPWLAIAPRPLNGDPHYEVAPLLGSRWDELVHAVSGERVRDGVRRRFHATVDAAGLDEARARDWVVVRAMHEVLEELARPATPDRDLVTRWVAVAKAVQD